MLTRVIHGTDGGPGWRGGRGHPVNAERRWLRPRLDRLLDQEPVDPERVGVQGFSLGSLIEARLVGTDSRPVAFGSWSGHVVTDPGFRALDHSCDRHSSMAASTALADLAPDAGVLLLVAGSDDTSADLSFSENAASASAGEDVTHEIIDLADHDYHVLTDDQALADQVIPPDRRLVRREVVAVDSAAASRT